ncbi:MAG: hypothetical protein Q9163_001918 [Psora crenata]
MSQSSCPVPPYVTSDKTSFAYVSASKRWPTGTIDDVHRSIFETEDEPKQKEGKAIVEALAKLKYEIQHDRLLTPLEDDGKSDITDYNKRLVSLDSPTWMNVPWLFAECYLYRYGRRVHTYFSRSTHWKSYDAFFRQKLSALKSSRPAILELAAKYKTLIIQLREIDENNMPRIEVEQAERMLFLEMCEICLWGNSTDLSLLPSLTYDDVQKLQGAEVRKSAEKNVLVSDLPSAYRILKGTQESGKEVRRIDIILDNAGFELFVDLILAGYLLESGLATRIILHPKTIPWYVSDVVAADFQTLLYVLARPNDIFPTEKWGTPAQSRISGADEENLGFLFRNWCHLHGEGQLILRPHLFWTTAYSYWELPSQEPELLEDLKQSEMVIFKGDLNYRKLTADARLSSPRLLHAMWSKAVPFASAIGPLGRGSGLRVLALRTCKSDAVVGLAEREDERIRPEDGRDESTRTKKWAWSGKYAVMQFCDGKT